MKIAVYGSASGDIPQDFREKARELGRAIAKRGHVLITGACPGLPYDAVEGANEHRGIVWGFSPARDLEEHVKRFKFPTAGFTEIKYLPKDFQYAGDMQACYKTRNVWSVAECDAAVFISGSKGSNTEFANAYAMGRVIGVLSGTGGITRKLISTTIEELSDGKEKPVIYNIDPNLLVFELETALTSQLA